MNIDYKQLAISNIKDAYLSVFPDSYITAQNAALGGDKVYFKCYLQKPEEWANKISHNDPLNYMFSYNPETGFYEEHDHSLTIKPTEKYMAYGRAKMRKRNIKNASTDKIKARFEQFKQLVINNLDNAAHDIAGKVSQ